MGGRVWDFFFLFRFSTFCTSLPGSARTGEGAQELDFAPGRRKPSRRHCRRLVLAICCWVDRSTRPLPPGDRTRVALTTAPLHMDQLLFIRFSFLCRIRSLWGNGGNTSKWDKMKKLWDYLKNPRSQVDYRECLPQDPGMMEDFVLESDPDLVGVFLAVLRIAARSDEIRRRILAFMDRMLSDKDKAKRMNPVVLVEVCEICLEAETEGFPSLRNLCACADLMLKQEKEVALDWIRTLFDYVAGSEESVEIEDAVEFLMETFKLENKTFESGIEKVENYSEEKKNKCVKGNKLINCLMLLTLEGGNTDVGMSLGNIQQQQHPTWSLFALPYNWLGRSAMHLAAVFLREKSCFRLIPRELQEEWKEARDGHGSTPLHLAHLHNNAAAQDYLTNCLGVHRKPLDHFGNAPESLAQREAQEKERKARFRDLCRNILERRKKVKDLLKEMIVMPRRERQEMGNDFQDVFAKIVKGRRFQRELGRNEYDRIEIAGSIGERTKVGSLSEADLNIWVRGDGLIDVRALGQCVMSEVLGACAGSPLRPISAKGPWKFLSEKKGDSSRGQCVSLDLVIIREESEDIDTNIRFLEDIVSCHRRLRQCDYYTWSKSEPAFKEKGSTFSELERRILGRLEMRQRCALLLLKSLAAVSDSFLFLFIPFPYFYLLFPAIVCFPHNPLLLFSPFPFVASQHSKIRFIPKNYI